MRGRTSQTSNPAQIEPLESRRLCAFSTLAATPPLGPSITFIPQVQGKTIWVNPGERISDAIDAASPGDHVVVRPGTYWEPITVTRSGEAARPIVVRAETPGSVTIDATANPVALVAAPGASNIFISGLTFTNAANILTGNHNAAVRTGDHWVVQDCIIKNSAGGGLGIFGDGVVVRRVIAEDNGRFGIGGTSCTNLLVQDSISRHNNLIVHDSNGGGGKFTRLNGAVIQRMQSYGNGGPGLWLDLNNVHATVTGCDFSDNLTFPSEDPTKPAWGDGIDVEVSGMIVKHVAGVETVTSQGSIVVERSRVKSNANHGIVAYASRNVILQHNLVSDDNIYLKDGGRSPFTLDRLSVIDNTLTSGYIEADADVVKGFRAKSLHLDNNRFINCQTLYKWNLTKHAKLKTVQNDLGFETSGVVE